MAWKYFGIHGECLNAFMMHHPQDPNTGHGGRGWRIFLTLMANHTAVQKRAGVSTRVRWKIDEQTKQILAG